MARKSSKGPKPVEAQESEDIALYQQEVQEMTAEVGDRLAAEMAHEKSLYEKMWQEDSYRVGSPGERLAHSFLMKFSPVPNQGVVDFGAGTGRAALAFRERGLKVVAIDFAENALDKAVKERLLDGFFSFVCADITNLGDTLKASLRLGMDYFYCTDVMEHLPSEEAVDAALAEIAEASRLSNGGFFNIATYADHVFAKVAGEPLHKTVQDATWWKRKVEKHFIITGEEVTALDVRFFVQPKEA